MGAGGVPNRTIVKIDGRSGDLPTKGAKPNSRYDLYEYGKKKQSRWFDENGKAKEIEIIFIKIFLKITHFHMTIIGNGLMIYRKEILIMKIQIMKILIKGVKK